MRVSESHGGQGRCLVVALGAHTGIPGLRQSEIRHEYPVTQVLVE
jgi:hypothetical protein